MPFTGVLVRYRANCTPTRGVRLAVNNIAEYEARAETDSYLGMMRWVHCVEVHVLLHSSTAHQKSIQWPTGQDLPLLSVAVLGPEVTVGGRAKLCEGSATRGAKPSNQSFSERNVGRHDTENTARMVARERTHWVYATKYNRPQAYRLARGGRH
jgi:hypothetical protein